MDNQVWLCRGVALIALAFGVALVLSGRRDLRRSWQAFAQQHGLGYATSGWLGHPSVLGMYRGRSLMIKSEDSFLTTRPRIVRTEVIVDLKLTNPLNLSLSKKSLLRQMGDAMVAPPTTTGDRFIDNLFEIHGHPEAAVIDLMRSPLLRPHLETTRDVQVTVSGASLAYHANELVEDIQLLVDYVYGLAEAMEAHDRAKPAR
jgi:hypothetical protein